MDERMSLRLWLDQYNLTQSWLIDVMRRRGLEVDKATLSGTLKGTITGPRVSKIMEVAHDIQSGCRWRHSMGTRSIS